MLVTRCNFNKIRVLKSSVSGFRNAYFRQKHTGRNKDAEINPKVKSEDSNLKLGDMATKYRVFREEESEKILDIHEERLKYAELLEETEFEEVNPFEGINLEHGKTGVFDIEDLVQVLRIENAEDICVISVPREIKYVDYMCICSTKSNRHMKALLQFVRKVYKQKRHENTDVPRTEGADSHEWAALDLGNIALHVFSKQARDYYDLDSLWAVGREFDKEYNKKDAVADMLEKHSIYLQDLQPAR